MNSITSCEEVLNRELDSIDVVMCTCNANEVWFKKCLKSIKDEIPVHCFIVVDCFSKDNTVEVVKQFFPKAKIVRTKAGLAESRKIGFEMVDTPWFGFFDSDIEFRRDWYKKILVPISKDVGAVAGLAIETHLTLERLADLRLSDKWLKTSKRNIIVTKHNPDAMRGLTGYTICRTEAVRDWAPPHELVAYEDHHLLRHIVKKGFKWVVVSDAQARHHGVYSCKTEYKKAKWNYAGARYIGATSLRRLAKNMVYIVLLAAYASLRLHDPRVITLTLSAHFGRIEGYLNWNKYMSSYINARVL